MTEQGRSLFGFKPDAHLDFAATFDRVHPEDRAAREGAIQRALETRGEYEMEYRVLAAGRHGPLDHRRGRCVEPDDGTGPKLFGVSMDVTARKQAEAAAARNEELRRSGQLEHVARVATLGELTATLTHELRQPLAAILANSTSALRCSTRPSPTSAEVRGTLADIGEITERAGDVISGTARHAQARHAGLRRRRPEPGDPHRRAHRARRRRSCTASRSTSTCRPTCCPVKGDSVQLQQVMLNLMLNAFSAMSGTGPRARARPGRAHGSIDGSSVLVEVQDSGTGIAAGKLESIFDPFVTSKPDGLGMGLSICRSIIERHGGTIWAANNPDRGATFSITLPVTRE